MTSEVKLINMNWCHCIKSVRIRGFSGPKKQTKKTPNTALSTQCVSCQLNYTYQKIEQHQNTKESKKKMQNTCGQFYLSNYQKKIRFNYLKLQGVKH